MKPAQSPDSQSLPLEEQLVGVNAKTGLYPGARSWSGGRFRVLGKGPLESYCYHVMSRTCGGEVLFDEVEKEALRRVIWRMAEFSGIKVVTYCLMGNHFHLLAEVPHRGTWLQRFEGPDGEAKLFERLRILYSRAYLGMLRDELADLRARGMAVLAEQRVDALKKRFCDLSLFVKEVKERFSRWFNKRRGRRGTLWMDRFKSAGAAAAYRCLLHAEGREVKDAQNVKVVGRGMSVEKVRAVLAEKGKLSPAELVRLRVRYFSDGLVLGSQEFVEGVFEEQRERVGQRRRQGGHRMMESEAPFFTLRQLRLRSLG